MQQQQEQPQEKTKRNKSKYDRLKWRILVFVAAVLVTQAVLSVGSILHMMATFPDDEYCICFEKETDAFQ